MFYRNYYSNKNSDFYVDESFDLPTIEEVVGEIHNANGLAFLAHPLAYTGTGNGAGDYIDAAIDANVDGIEVYHYSADGNDILFLNRFAKKHGLLVSGGSDFHGSSKPYLRLGTGYGGERIRYSDIENWIRNIRIIPLG